MAPDTAATVTAEQLAEKMLVLIRDSLWCGEVPPGVRTFSELHDFVDANEYLIEAREGLGLPAIDESEPEPDFTMDNAACDIVTSRLPRVASAYPQRKPCNVEQRTPGGYSVCRGCGWNSERGEHVDSVVIQVHRQHYGVVLSGKDGSGYKLFWTDFVANDWTEDYTTLAIALARFAALDYAVLSEGTFVEGPDEFAVMTQEWIDRTSDGGNADAQ